MGKLPEMNLFPYPLINIELAKIYFDFPPGHPKPNSVYAMCNIFPNQYVPLNNFHRYFQELKHSSFIDLCGYLGAKEVYLEHAVINNKSLNIDLSAGDIPTELGNLGLGLKGGYSKGKNSNYNLAFSFSEKNKEIKDYDSPWLNSEPTWKSMKENRQNNFAESFKAEYNYNDDFGINGSIFAELSGMGINIGGSSQDFNSIKLIYKVIFW